MMLCTHFIIFAAESGKRAFKLLVSSVLLAFFPDRWQLSDDTISPEFTFFLYTCISLLSPEYKVLDCQPQRAQAITVSKKLTSYI